MANRKIFNRQLLTPCVLERSAAREQMTTDKVGVLLVLMWWYRSDDKKLVLTFLGNRAVAERFTICHPQPSTNEVDTLS